MPAVQGTVTDWARASSADCAGVVSTLGPGADANAITRARQHFNPEVVSCAVELAQGRAKTGDKWPAEIAGRIVGDREGIEMASSWNTANHKARRFAAAGVTTVVDLCCGIGGDAMGLARQGLGVIGVDHDPIRAWMCAQNASNGPGRCEALGCDVLDESVLEGAAFHLDPARRTDGKRVTRYEDLIPGPEVVNTIVDSRPCGAVKLNPGIDAGSLPRGEVEILSERGRLTQAVLWTGSLAECERRATVIDRAGQGLSIHGEPSRSDERHPIGEVIYAMDPSAERADLVPVLAEKTGLVLVQPGLGLLTSSGGLTPGHDAEGLRKAFLTPFTVLADLPWNPKRVKKHLATLRAGVVEVKTRGGAVHPDEQQRRLRGSGERVLTVFVYRFDQGVRALITQRCPADGGG